MEQVRQAIVVQVHHCRTPAHVTRLHPQALPHCHIVEIPRTIIPIKHRRVIGKMRFVDIEVPVQVEIPHADAHTCLLHAVFADRRPALEAGFCEGSVPIIAKQ